MSDLLTDRKVILVCRIVWFALTEMALCEMIDS